MFFLVSKEMMCETKVKVFGFLILCLTFKHIFEKLSYYHILYIAIAVRCPSLPNNLVLRALIRHIEVYGATYFNFVM